MYTVYKGEEYRFSECFVYNGKYVSGISTSDIKKTDIEKVLLSVDNTDITKRETYDNLDGWIDSVKSSLGDSNEYMIVLLGNKLDLINNMDESNTVISCYTQGDFTDLCRGPHVETVKLLK